MLCAAKAAGAYICGSVTRSIYASRPAESESAASDRRTLVEVKYDGNRECNFTKPAYLRRSTAEMGDLARGTPGIAAAGLGLLTKSCVFDGDTDAAVRHGQPEFFALSVIVSTHASIYSNGTAWPSRATFRYRRAA